MFSSYELEILLNHDPNGPAYQVEPVRAFKNMSFHPKNAYLSSENLLLFYLILSFQHGERMHLNRLKLAIKYRQKKVTIHSLKIAEWKP